VAHVLAEALSDGVADSQRRVKRGRRVVPAAAGVADLREVVDRLGEAFQLIGEAVGGESK
jgi:hypothetical protein